MTSSDLRFRLQTCVEYSFPVTFTRQVFAPGNTALAQAADPSAGGAALFLDEGVARRLPALAEEGARALRAQSFDLRGEAVLLPGGEEAKKGLTVVERALAEIARLRLCRHSYLFVVGGGAFLDAVGLAAALAHRGIRLVRLPTTALAQGDSGVGVKNGVNLFGQKNFAGSFAPPHAVVNDLAFLASLPQPLRLDGIAEAFKVSLIKDAEFFRYLEENAPAIAAGGLPQIEQAVIRSARLHAEHIATGGDPFELGSARPLDFGHWAAHRLENLSLHRLRHGQAVAIGMALDILYARASGILPSEDAERTLRTFRTAGLRLWDDVLLLRENAEPAIFAGLREFKEHLGGELAITLPTGIGVRCEVSTIDLPRMEGCLAELHALTSGQTAQQPA